MSEKFVENRRTISSASKQGPTSVPHKVDPCSGATKGDDHTSCFQQLFRAKNLHIFDIRVILSQDGMASGPRPEPFSLTHASGIRWEERPGIRSRPPPPWLNYTRQSKDWTSISLARLFAWGFSRPNRKSEPRKVAQSTRRPPTPPRLRSKGPPTNSSTSKHPTQNETRSQNKK